jgi:hypothetical protein
VYVKKAKFILRMAFIRQWSIPDLIEIYYPDLSLDEKCQILDEVEKLTFGAMNHENSYHYCINDVCGEFLH